MDAEVSGEIISSATTNDDDPDNEKSANALTSDKPGDADLEKLIENHKQDEQQGNEAAAEPQDEFPNGSEDSKSSHADGDILRDQSGIVSKARRFGLTVTFKLNEMSCTAGLLPGCAYVNGKTLLLDAVKSEAEMNLHFLRGTIVNFDCIRSKATSSSPEPFDCDWRIIRLWFAEKPEPSSLLSTTDLSRQERSFHKRQRLIFARLIRDSTRMLKDVSMESWFITTVPIFPLPHPNTATNKALIGSVEKLILPVGGIIKVGEEQVFFHRARLFLQDGQLSATADLSKVLDVGTKVTVNSSTLEELKSFSPDIEKHCPEDIDQVALLVYTGQDSPNLPEIIFKETEISHKDGVLQPYYTARITSFDPPGPTGVESGIAEILTGPESELSLADGNKVKFLETELQVRFHRKDLIYLGASMEKADLRYFFNPGLFDIYRLHCYLKPIEDEAQADDIKFEVSLGWKSTIKYRNPYDPKNSASVPTIAEDTLLFPPGKSFGLLKCCTRTDFLFIWPNAVYSYGPVNLMARESLDVSTYERILQGKMPSLEESILTNPDFLDNKDVAIGRIEELYAPVKKDSYVSSGRVRIITGPMAGKSAQFSRGELAAFGHDIGNADLQLFLSQNDPIFIRTGTALDDKDELKVTEGWIGWPKRSSSKCSLDELPEEELLRVMVWLDLKSMLPRVFKSAVFGKGPVRQFVPFRGDTYEGEVVQLKREDGGSDQANCAIGGVIKVVTGPFAGQYVYFDREITFALGFNLKFADLTHFFFEGQKVAFESNENKKGVTKLLEDFEGTTLAIQASLVWINEFNSRVNITRSAAHSPRLSIWLSQRGLDFDEYKGAIRGELPPVRRILAKQNKSNMLKIDEDADACIPDSGSRKAKNLLLEEEASAKAVCKFGPDAVKVCDRALNAKGPADPKLKNLIQNESQAEYAHHICKALEFALNFYKGKHPKYRKELQMQRRREKYRQNYCMPFVNPFQNFEPRQSPQANVNHHDRPVQSPFQPPPPPPPPQPANAWGTNSEINPPGTETTFAAQTPGYQSHNQYNAQYQATSQYNSQSYYDYGVQYAQNPVQQSLKQAQPVQDSSQLGKRQWTATNSSGGMPNPDSDSTHEQSKKMKKSDVSSYISGQL